MNFEAFLKEQGKPVEFESGQHVFRQGDHCASIFYVVSGLLKAYYLSPQGKENIKSFIQTGDTIGSMSACHQHLPCTFSLIALSDLHLIQFSAESLLAATGTSHALAQQLIDQLMALSMKKEQREYEFLMLSAEERFVQFRQREPALVQALTQNDIARYLGITPVALSRIKNRLPSQ